MFLERVHTPGLAALSYVVGADGGDAVVIDPRWDVDVYLDHLRAHGARLRWVLATHRHEDFVDGSRTLAALTGARAAHGGVELTWGEPLDDGAVIELGDHLRLEALATPGHTLGHLAYVLYDTSTGDSPVGVFTGDALFVGDVGRADFYPDRAREVAGLLYESLHDKLLPLGDHCLVWPAHGAGSVCGDAMADRDFSTLGYERRHNPRLQLPDRDAFIRAKLAEDHPQPPYFRRMEEVNGAGPRPLERLPELRPVPAGDLAARLDDDADDVVLLDVREPQAFGESHVPGALAIPADMLPSFAGWLIPGDAPIVLVADDAERARDAARHLVRLGYERLDGYLQGGITAWETAGRRLGHVPPIQVAALSRGVERGDVTVLDVRSDGEWDAGHLRGATHVYLGELPARLASGPPLPDDRPLVTLCGSGRRAIIAASLLLRHGHDDVVNSFGSMAACQSAGCPMGAS
ncbi:MAG: MBL fold metallo-hydrolase [Deltaproteobacteria bacterium]|nr:MBL fold metallo-hydrolase [Deltaproteobacteria bacterium]